MHSIQLLVQKIKIYFINEDYWKVDNYTRSCMAKIDDKDTDDEVAHLSKVILYMSHVY